MERVILLKNFHAKKLNNDRDIHIYLPPSYYSSTAKYPVLYMHDGQGLFNANPYSNQSWNVYETVEKLIRENKIAEIIIVGIDNKGVERSNEYTHSMDGTNKIEGLPEIKCCKGELYEDFIIHDLKPYIDANYRTQSDRNHTALMGSSMGGLVTYNILFRHPEIFGKVGILSPYFVKLDLNTLDVFPVCKFYTKKVPVKIWLDVGEYEANILPQHVRKMADHLYEIGWKPIDELSYYVVTDAAHTETDWSKRLSIPLLYLFGNIGTLQSIRLPGRKMVGLSGIAVRINPELQFSTGFKTTGLTGQYFVENPEILEVGQDGMIQPKHKGSTKVTYRYGGLETSAEYTVVDPLSEYVSVSIAITVPEKTPDNAYLTVNKIIVHKISGRTYGGQYSLPRDIGVQFAITCHTGDGKAFAEIDSHHHAVCRRFRAENDKKLSYTVEGWSNPE